jgi:hypothetical protein
MKLKIKSGCSSAPAEFRCSSPTLIPLLQPTHSYRFGGRFVPIYASAMSNFQLKFKEQLYFLVSTVRTWYS